jgi:hypothetical protein
MAVFDRGGEHMERPHRAPVDDLLQRWKRAARLLETYLGVCRPVAQQVVDIAQGGVPGGSVGACQGGFEPVDE